MLAAHMISLVIVLFPLQHFETTKTSPQLSRFVLLMAKGNGFTDLQVSTLLACASVRQKLGEFNDIVSLVSTRFISSLLVSALLK